MVTYEYVCLGCEHPFEERRPMTGAVDTALACPSCGSERVRRRFSLFATSGGTTSSGGTVPSGDTATAGGCACGGACACGG